MTLRNLGTLLKAFRGSGKTAIVDLSDGGREHGYDAIDDACNAVARGLQARSCGPGERVGVLSHNRVEYVTTVLGAMRAGCVPVPINTKLKAPEIAQLAGDAGLRLLFVDEALRDLCPPAVERVDFDGDEHPYADFLRPGPFEAFVPGPADASLLLYTSGSAGRSKGVRLGHEGHAWLMDVQRGRRPPGLLFRVLVQSPLYHKAGLRFIKTALANGDTTILVPRFDAKTVIEAIAKYKVSVMTGTATVFGMILRERELLEATDLSSVLRIGVGGEPVSPRLLEELGKYFPQSFNHQGYGSTEIGGVFMLHPEPSKRPPDSVGHPLPGVELRLEGGATPDEGVLWVKGPSVMLGYHNRPEENAERLKDGWFDTRDIFRRDADGNYYFRCRADDMFVCGGENVYPGEVEAILRRHEDVLVAAVVDVANETFTRVPVAFVVPRSGSTLTEDALRDFARANGPTYMHPRRVYFEAELPLASTGKVDRAQLRALAAERARG